MESYLRFLSEQAESNRKNLTYSEQRVHRFLIKNKIKHRMQIPIMCKSGKGYIVDCLLPCKKIIEIDGGYHNTKEQQIKDTKREEDLIKMGYEIVRVTNEETKLLNGDFLKKINYYTKPKITPTQTPPLKKIKSKNNRKKKNSK